MCDADYSAELVRRAMTADFQDRVRPFADVLRRLGVDTVAPIIERSRDPGWYSATVIGPSEWTFVYPPAVEDDGSGDCFLVAVYRDCAACGLSITAQPRHEDPDPLVELPPFALLATTDLHPLVTLGRAITASPEAQRGLHAQCFVTQERDRRQRGQEAAE